jgi:hypothetical protein
MTDRQKRPMDYRDPARFVVGGAAEYHQAIVNPTVTTLQHTSLAHSHGHERWVWRVGLVGLMLCRRHSPLWCWRRVGELFISYSGRRLCPLHAGACSSCSQRPTSVFVT